MSRDASGTYTAPSNSFNPAVEGQTIDESDWNTTLQDIEDALTDSLSISGKGKVTHHIDFDEASVASPAANVGRLYVADVGGVTTLKFKDSGGTDYNLLLSSPGLAYTFSTSTTTNADPGSGYVRFNNATLSSVTEIAIDDNDANGADLSAYVLTWDDVGSSDRGTLIIQNRTAPANVVIFTISGASTDESGYTRLAVTYVTHAGSFSANAPLGVTYTKPGATGATGATGSNGAAGANGTDPGIRWLFDSSTTTNADPGSGDLRLNNATLASVTEIAISYSSGESGNPSVENFVKAWDDSTTTGTRGTLILKKASAPENFAIYTITSAITDGTTYGRFTLSYVVAAGSFSNTDTLAVQFIRTGDKGADGAGTGDVVGPGSATDNAVARFDGTTGKLVQNSGITIDDSNNVSGVGTLGSGAQTITSASALALAVGANGTTNPVLQVDDSTASVATGVKITGAAAAGRVALAAISSGTNEGLSIDAKGSGTIRLGATSTGDIEFSRAAVPTASDGAALGSVSLMWADLFLASGGVVNFNNGDVTITHSANALAFAGAASGYTFDSGLTITGGLFNATAVNSGIELGALGSSNTPFVDFHSSSSTTDYDVRLLASGGTASSGAGTLTFIGASFTFGTSTPVTLGTLELGHATDTTLARSAAGEVTVEGTLIKKVGKETIWIPASAMTARTTNGAAAGTLEMTTNKNMFSTLDYDTTTQEFAQFEIHMPKSWNLGTLTFQPVWSHAATTTNFGVVWELAAVARSDDDVGDVAFGTAQSSTDTGGTTNDIYIGPESSAVTVAGTPAAGDTVQFQLARAPANGSDTMAIDARLHGIRLFYTTNASTDV